MRRELLGKIVWREVRKAGVTYILKSDIDVPHDPNRDGIDDLIAMLPASERPLLLTIDDDSMDSSPPDPTPPQSGMHGDTDVRQDYQSQEQHNPSNKNNRATEACRKTTPKEHGAKGGDSTTIGSSKDAGDAIIPGSGETDGKEGREGREPTASITMLLPTIH
jgi:hypothetical protein